MYVVMHSRGGGGYVTSVAVHVHLEDVVLNDVKDDILTQ
jgi:transcriptional regulator CtsR